MSFDIRRCSKEDLDRLNAEGKAWRERVGTAQKPESWLESEREKWLEENKDNPNPIVQHVAESFRNVLHPPQQLDLWGEERPHENQ